MIILLISYSTGFVKKKREFILDRCLSYDKKRTLYNSVIKSVVSRIIQLIILQLV